jgi:hypothetical protein
MVMPRITSAWVLDLILGKKRMKRMGLDPMALGIGQESEG